MNINTQKIKKVIITNLPLIIFFWLGNKISFAYRIAPGNSIYQKMTPFLNNFLTTVNNPMPSFNITDITIGIVIAVAFKLFLIYKKKNAKKFRHGKEYGDAKWSA